MADAGGKDEQAAEAKAVAELAADVAHLSQTVKGYPEKFKTVLRTVQQISGQADKLGQLLAILLLAFIVHQLFLWVDRDPEVAFERAALAFEIAEVVWDSHGIVWNALTDVVNSGVIPIWNAASFYLVEPIVVLILEIFSLVFTQRHYAGLFSEADFPYAGLDCTKSYEASEFCGRYEAYAARLESAEKAPYFVNETQGPSIGGRRLSAAHPEVYTFGLATARRLSELTDDELFVAPSFDSEQVTTGLDDASSIGISLGAPVADVGTSVVFNVLQSSFSVIMDVLFIVVKSLMEAIRWVIKSGLVATLMNIGVEFVIIFCRHQIEPPTNRVVSPPPRCAVTEIAIPSLMAAINALMCAIDLFQPSTWTAQFECIEAKCFRGPDALADMLVFTSVPLTLTKFANVVESTMNSRTARRFFQPTAGFSTKGRTRRPGQGGNEVIDNAEPESEADENPAYEFTFAQDFEDWLPTTGAETCGGCFVCKFPELRLVFLLVASMVSLFSEGNYLTVSQTARKTPYLATTSAATPRTQTRRPCPAPTPPTPTATPAATPAPAAPPRARPAPPATPGRSAARRPAAGTRRPRRAACAPLRRLCAPGPHVRARVLLAQFAGNVTQTCMGGGRWYEQACGPRGAELLSHESWLAGGYTAGYAQLDSRIVDSFAATLLKRGEDVGPDERFGPAIAAAASWYRARGVGDTLTNEAVDDQERAKAAVFTHQMCRLMRTSDVGEEQDEGPGFVDHAGGDLGRVAAHYLYESCKRFKHNTFGDVNRFFHDLTYEVTACAQDKVQCAKDERKCLGLCSGVDNSPFRYDFHTVVARTELSTGALGVARWEAAEANCTIKTTTLYVPTFDGGDSFKTFAARLRVRSGMTAIGARAPPRAEKKSGLA